MELYKLPDNSFEVEVFYKYLPENDTDAGVQLTIPGCPERQSCSFEVMFKGFDDKIKEKDYK